MLTLDLCDWKHATGEDPALPGLLVGWRLSEKGPVPPLASLEPCPPWLLGVDACAGGACMFYPTLCGLLLSLWGNHGRLQGAGLLAAFEAMNADPDWATLRSRFPELVKLTLTSGTRYTKAQLEELHRFVSRRVTMPPFDEGVEALVRLAPHDVLAHFAGWRLWALECDAGVRAELFTYPECDDMVLSQYRGRIRSNQSERLGPGHLAKLVHSGRKLGLDGPPRVYLVWENSD